ncbi:MAG: TIR domain-containing protein [Steroidobacteraceae bacterium]
MAEGGSGEKASGTTPSVFVSYASQDAAAAAALVKALERHGIPCWIAPRDVRPGAQYADAIVRAINEARTVVLVLSGNAVSSSHVAREVERASSKHKPIIAFRIDSAPLAPALEYFLSESQWIDVVKLGMPAALAKLSGAVGQGSGLIVAAASVAHPKSPRTRILFAVGVAVVAVALAALWADKVWISKRVPASQPVASAAPQSTRAASSTPATEAAFAPPSHSIAVLPFVNGSGDKEQEYFSDGLTEQLLNSLSRITELQVAGRTSSFYFKGKDVDLSTVVHKLNVATVLEGSVRRSGHTVRITAQLVNAVTGFQLWSRTYDRNLGDVLKLQSEIANAVASALEVTLLNDVAAKIELGGTRNPLALDAYLRGSKLTAATAHSAAEVRATIDAYTDALRADPNFALAYAARARARMNWGYFLIEAPQDAFASARTDAGHAIALAPELGDGHAALGEVLENGFFDFAGAAKEHERALALAPGDARVLRAYSHFATYMGHTDAAIACARRNVELDPLNVLAYRTLGEALHTARRYKEAIAVYDQAIGLSPGHASEVYQRRARSYYMAGDFPLAKASCEAEPDHYQVQLCMPLVYERLGERAAAEAALTAAIAAQREFSAYQYAQIYAQWGDAKKALDWLDTALRIRDTGLEYLKTDAFLDPLRSQPRFQAIERQLKFTD